jgi:Ca2+-binding RTX toxin-like protein
VVYLGNGNGTFGTGTPYAVGTSPQDVVIARLNADAAPDLAVASQVGGAVAILLNNGSGIFAAGTPVAPPTGDPDGVAAADFDGDGHTDLAIGTTGGGELAWARNAGTGAGTFEPAVALGTMGAKVAAGDVNKDGRVDIVASRTGSGNVAVVLRNAASPGFQAATTFDPDPTGAGGAGQLALTDLDADGVLDIALSHVSGPQAAKVSVAIGRGNGLFDLNGFEPVGALAFQVVAADLNGDSHPDLATANSGPNTVSVILARPPAVSIAPATLAFGDQVAGIASGEQRFTIRNEGGPRLNVGTAVLGGPNADQFALTSNGCAGASLPPGASCEVGATFTPSGLGARSASITVASNGGPRVVQLTGAGVLRPGACANRLDGTAAGNRLRGTGAGDNIFGLSGNDILSGLAGRDCLSGGGGNDRLSGGGDNDRLNGGTGRDRLNGGTGRDRLGGGSGNDRLNGGGGVNRVSGGSGNDTINARNRRRDRVSCGPGRDTVTADRRDRLSRCERVSRARR